MEKKFVGRERECAELNRCLQSDRSELVIVYGRRRVGKTFLIEQHFKQKFDFWYVGVRNISTKDQLRHFAKSLRKYSGKGYTFSSWWDAFDALEEYLETLPKNRKKVIFIDEMPWMDTGRSRFVSALENFWNGWCARRDDIMLIATGSATTWMRDKIIGNQGGLHARTTCLLHLAPFTLHEVELYLQARKIRWQRYDILQAYMALGGVPYYYSLLNPTLSLAQNIDALFFAEGGNLRNEFDELYNALFNDADLYIDIVKALAAHRSGMTHKEIMLHIKRDGTQISKALNNLERCDFIECWAQYGNKKREQVFRLMDFYTLFYYKFIAHDTSKNEQWWTTHLESASVRAWMGISFETLCMAHHQQIKKALGIDRIGTSIAAWHCAPNEAENLPGAQIDMIIERADRLIHLCEMKFSQKKFNITADYEDKLRERMWLFDLKTHNTKPLVHTFVTTYGVANPLAHSIVHSEVPMDDLFEV